VTRIRSSHALKLTESVQRQIVLPVMLLASSSVLLLSGCSSALNLGNGSAGSSDGVAISAVKGTVHGGQFPIDNATVSLYEIGATASTAKGYGAAITSGQLLGSATTSGAGGTWSIPNPTPCANASDELYLVASGGEEYNTSNSANSALTLTSVGGPCGSQFTTSFNIDEVTTIATEYALAGFSKGYAQVGTSATNAVGLVNAFATVTNLVSLAQGSALTNTPAYATPPANSTPDVFGSVVPYDTINTLADVIATCVNAAGGATDPACASLFSYTGGSNSLPSGNGVNNSPNAGTTQNTADAVLYIAHNPGLPGTSGVSSNNVATVYALTPPSPPFGPTLTTAPNDFTLTVNFVGGGLGGVKVASNGDGTYVAIDANGNLWIPEPSFSSLTELNNLGAPISPTTQVKTTTPYTLMQAGGFPVTGAEALTVPDVDIYGNVWIGDSSECLVGVSSSGASLSGSPYTSFCPSTQGAQGVAIDGSNNVWVASGSDTGSPFIVAVANPSPGTGPYSVLSGFPVTSGLDILAGWIGPDEAGNVWFTDDGDNDGGFVSSTGAVTIPYMHNFGGGPGPFGAFGGLSSGSGGNGGLALWIPQPSVNNVQPVNATSPYVEGSAILSSTGQGEGQIEADGYGNFLWTNQGNENEDLPANITVYTSGEAQVSEYSTGYDGGSAQTTLDGPYGFAIDQSGNVWVVNASNYDAATKKGPYGTGYKGNGSGSANVTEFIGLAGPTQPLDSLKAKDSTYGTLP
jgi:hypothetical protein